MKIRVLDRSGADAGSVSAPSLLAEGEIHSAALHQSVTAYLANQRSGTSKVKSRGEVRGSGRKMYRQKGTGYARMGDRQSPIRVGGGVAFGPKPRSYRQKTPRKMKRLALLSALRSKLQGGGIMIVDSLPGADEPPKTKRVAELLDNLGAAGGKSTLVTAEAHRWLVVSSRNIPTAEAALSSQLHPYQILTRDALIFTKEGWRALLSRLGVEEEEEAALDAPAESLDEDSEAEAAPAESLDEDSEAGSEEDSVGGGEESEVS